MNYASYVILTIIIYYYHTKFPLHHIISAILTVAVI